jgi:hypothetical protein
VVAEVTTYPQIGATCDSTVLPQGATDLIDGAIQNILVTSPDSRDRFTVSGGAAGWPGIQDCIIMPGGLSGLTPGFKHIDLKGARQAGVSWTGTVYDTCNLTMPLQAHANTPQGLSKLVSKWVGAWNPVLQPTFEYWTLDRGYWWFPARWADPFNDPLKQMPRLVRYWEFTQKIRNDLAFWLGMPSTCAFPQSFSGWSGSGSGWLQLSNIGDQDGWMSVLCCAGSADGAIFAFANGPGSTTMITFGPLDAGQIVLFNTLQRLPRVVDLTPNQTQSSSTSSSSGALLNQLINFVSGNNVPPLLQQFESKFGALPANQPALASLITGNYTNPISGVAQPEYAELSSIACSITGGNSTSQMVASITPMRVWPE